MEEDVGGLPRLHRGRQLLLERLVFEHRDLDLNVRMRGHVGIGERAIRCRLTILGVVREDVGECASAGDENAWTSAIKNDDLTWTHVSDLKFWNSMVVPMYNIEGIPYNVLVDPTGKIIAESLRGEDLERKLAEVLK